jgi:phospholipid-translocating ATPase
MSGDSRPGQGDSPHQNGQNSEASHNTSALQTSPPTTSTTATRNVPTPTLRIPTAATSPNMNEPSPTEPNVRTVRFSSEVERTENLTSPISSTARSPRRSVPSSGYFGLSRIPSASNVSPEHNGGSRSPSPTSPGGGRNRGYSLRSSIFRRNVEGQGLSNPLETIESNTVNPLGSNQPIDDSTKSTKPKKDPLPPSALPNYQSWLANKPKERSAILTKIDNVTERLTKIILRIQDIPPSKDGRHITLDANRTALLVDERTNKPFIENWIRSTRYTVSTFLPRQLFAQFSKLANFYFLCISVLQMIPGLSTTGQYTTIAPLLFFVGISMGKEAIDDLRRYKLDKEENRKDATILLPNQDSGVPPNQLKWITVQWKDLRVGNIIKLKRDEPVPADIILLNAQNENQIAHVETMALDGETNFKSKITTAALAQACDAPEKLLRCRAEFVIEDPNLNLYAFEGKVTVDGKTSPLTNSEIIYRGSVIRNTPEILGMVIYTGEECKIRMNANKNPRTKAPHLQFVLNKIVSIVVVFVICLALFCSFAYLVWRSKVEVHAWYIIGQVPFHQIITGFIIMFSTMIPLSLYISMEIIKLAQMFLLNDIDMYDETTNTPMEARTSTINEELGQITHIFTDKTGTLTDNVMKFRKMSVAGTVWLHDADLQGPRKELLMHKQRGKGKKSTRRISTTSKTSGRKSSIGNVEREAGIYQDSKWKSSARAGAVQHERRTEELIRYLQRFPDTLFASKARLLLLSIALCHTCLPETKEDGSIAFQTSSPDELALVQAAQDLGYLVFNRGHSTLTLKLYPNGYDGEAITETYEILDVIEFSSTRKRMSVVVRFPDGRICVMCKGADSIVMQRLKLAGLAIEKATEVEHRVEQRKSMEAQVALARRSTQMERARSLRRTSVTISAPRRSTSVVSQHDPVNEVDSWLRSRERDVELVGEEDRRSSYRPSGQINRMSWAVSEPRSSMADDSFEDFVDDAVVTNDAITIERCFQHINDFATEGLRTLLYAYRFLDDNEYASWKEIYHAATTSFSQREEKMETAGELIEVNLDLAGATAIEDKLQYGVPESMDKLRRANIKIWMLTGDKRETAINIGHSCRLIKDYSLVIVLDKATEDVEHIIAAATLELQNKKVAHSVVVIDGQTLSWIDEADHRQYLFYELALLADSVICCRAQPSQKAELVHAIRTRVKDSITLAIGDGANDIAMIQEAHVGIGITGKEGLQAARTSDYSIAQFRFLNKLLLVHGRWNYIRTCKYILGTLWKEIVFFLTQAMFQRYVGYTGTSLYEPWSLATFNTLFTSLPVLIMGIFEKDLAPATLLAAPELYAVGQKNQAFNFWIFLQWTILGIGESALIFYSMFLLYGTVNPGTQDIFPMGDLTFAACIFLIAIKMQLIEMHNKSIMCLLAFVISISAIFLWNILLDLIYPRKGIYRVRGGLFHEWGRDPRWWIGLFFAVCAVVALELCVQAAKKTIWLTETEIFQGLEKDPAVRRRFEEASAMELRQGWEATAEAQRLQKEKKGRGKNKEVEEIKIREPASSGEVELREIRGASHAGQGLQGGAVKEEDWERQLTERFGVKRTGTLR